MVVVAQEAGGCCNVETGCSRTFALPGVAGLWAGAWGRPSKRECFARRSSMAARTTVASTSLDEAARSHTPTLTQTAATNLTKWKHQIIITREGRWV
jgi:hypothetical protein